MRTRITELDPGAPVPGLNGSGDPLSGGARNWIPELQFRAFSNGI